MDGVLIETENMLARGRLDLPLTLCFAALRGDDLLLHHLLKRGLDPNESDNNGRTALHAAASKGNESCLCASFAGFSCRSKIAERTSIIWEAMLGGHESVVRLLTDNGAKLTSGDIGSFSCTASERNNLRLLKDIARLGGDVTHPRNDGSTALHIAVCEGNLEIVRFLLDKGSNVHQQDDNEWTPCTLAEQQGHEDILRLFESCEKKEPTAQVESVSSRFLPSRKSEPRISPTDRGGSSLVRV